MQRRSEYPALSDKAVRFLIQFATRLLLVANKSDDYCHFIALNLSPKTQLIGRITRFGGMHRI